MVSGGGSRASDESMALVNDVIDPGNEPNTAWDNESRKTPDRNGLGDETLHTLQGVQK